MRAVSPNAPIVCVGNGPVFLLTAKTAAAMGHPTTIVSADPELFSQLLWGLDETPLELLSIVGVKTEEDVEKFNAAVESAEGLIVCFDRPDQTLPDKLLEVVKPSEKKRVVLLSRHLNGKGNGALCAAAKGAANTEVWVAAPGNVDALRSLEETIKGKNDDVVIVRAGTLKGGGPGDAQSMKAKGDLPTLSYGFYKQGQQDLVNWRLLFDCDTNGVELTRGDTAEGPGWRAILAASSAEAEKGDSGRVGVAQALVRSLTMPQLSNKDFGIQTKSARLPPTDDEWEEMLSKV